MLSEMKNAVVAGAKAALAAVAGPIDTDIVIRATDEEERRLPVIDKPKRQPSVHRGKSNEPSDQLVQQVLVAFPQTEAPSMVMAIIGRMGYQSIRDYDRAATRAERWVANNRNTRKRMPTHIREKYALKAIVEACLTERFGAVRSDKRRAMA